MVDADMEDPWRILPLRPAAHNAANSAPRLCWETWNGVAPDFGYPTLLSPLPRHRRQRAAFAISRVLEIDPVVGIDAIERNRVARAQHAHENAPRRDLRLCRTARDIRIVAGELHADRIAADHLMEGVAVVDVFVVVAVATVAMGGHEMFRHRPIDGAVGLDPHRDATAGRFLRLLLRTAACRTRGPLGLMHDDVPPGMGFRHVAPGREPDH